MNLKQLNEIVAPQSRLNLDTSVHVHATDEDGNLIISEDTGKPIHIAQDTHSGDWYAKVGDSFPFFGSAKQKEGLQPLIDAGAVHVPHQNEKYRGLWVPLAWKTVVAPESASKE